MKVSLWIGDKKFSEWDVPSESKRSETLAMTIVDGEVGHILFTEFALAKKTPEEEIFKLISAYSVKDEHLSALENITKPNG